MPWILGIVGALFGALAADADRSLFGLLAGSAIGGLLGAHINLRRRFDALGAQLARSGTVAPPGPRSAAAPANAPAPPAPAAATIPPVADAAPGWRSAPPPPAPAPPRPAALGTVLSGDAAPEAVLARSAHAVEPTLDERIVATLKRWLFEGNLPVKIGLVFLFFGSAYGLKWASDNGLFSFPIEYRFLGVAVAALALLGWGWRQRHTRPVFGLSLQGGAIGVLLLAVFAAFRMYQLLPPGAAFALVVVLVAGGALLAVLQDAVALAALAFIGGYLAPVLISTGSGDHVALFSYYAVLNLAVLAIAWFRPWRALNLVGFLFTFLVGSAWGIQYYRPELFASVEPFLVGFFLFYVAIPVLYALRGGEGRRGFVDGTLVFGTPLLAFPLQAALLVDDRMALAYSALAVAVLYAGLAWWLLRRAGQQLLAQSFGVLAVGFATVAVPLALSSRWTSAVWALQGAGLVWLGLRQRRWLPKIAGWLLQGLAAVAYVLSVDASGWSATPGEWPVLNGHALGLLCMMLGAMVISRLHENAGGSRWSVWPPFLLGLLWWFVAGLREIVEHGSAWRDDAPWIAFATVGLLLAAGLRRALRWPRLGWPVVGTLVVGVLLALGSIASSVDGPLDPPQGAAWLAWLLAAVFALRGLDAPTQRGLSWAHVGLLATIATVGGGQLWATTTQSFDDGWSHAAAILPLLLLAALARWRPRVAGWPLGDTFSTYAGRWQALAAIGLGLWWMLSQASAGNAAPLPWLPLLNPLELIQLAVLLFLAMALPTPLRRILLPAAGFVLLSVATLRGVHHLEGAPWSVAILDSRIAQTSLTVAWCIAGVLAWVLGSKRRSRGLWTAGAALMAIVLAKLVIVDRSYIGDLPGIVSFLAVGSLLVAVGYLAPSPPRREAEASP